MHDAYYWLAFAQAALPTVGITVVVTVAIVLLVVQGPDGQKVLIATALRIFDWLLPERPAAVERGMKRTARRATLRGFERDWKERQIQRKLLWRVK